MKTTKNKHIIFKINDKQFTLFKSFCKKNNITMSQFLRDIISFIINNKDHNTIMIKDDEFKKNLIYEVNRHGNNLNQIAHKLNIAIKSDNLSRADLIDLQTAIKNILDLKKEYIHLRMEVRKRL